MQRRDFLQLLSGFAGVVLVAGCGSDANEPAGVAPVLGAPLGYRFTSLLKTGDPLPGGSTVAQLPHLVQTWDGGVVFHAVDQQGRRGVYSLTLGERAARALLVEGQTLPDGTLVRKLTHRGDVNPEGHYAAVVVFGDGTEGVVLAGGAAPRRVLGTHDPAPGLPTARFSSAYLGLSLGPQDDLLVSSQFTTRKPSRAYHGLFHLPGARAESAQLLLRSGLPGPEMQGTLAALGLPYLGDGGRYLIQTFGAPNAQPGGPLDSHPTALLAGRVGSQAVPLSAHPTLGVSPLRAASSQFQAGVVFGNGRCFGESLGYVVQPLTGGPQLIVNDRILSQAGDRSPRGRPIAGFNPPAFGAQGQVFYLALTGAASDPATRGAELVLAIGEARYTLLASGDQVDGLPVHSLSFGQLSDQANRNGLVATVANLPGQRQTLVAGQPV